MSKIASHRAGQCRGGSTVRHDRPAQVGGGGRRRDAGFVTRARWARQQEETVSIWRWLARRRSAPQPSRRSPRCVGSILPKLPSASWITAPIFYSSLRGLVVLRKTSIS